jgi:tetratricopeptide (TPR) repeat protein
LYDLERDPDERVNLFDIEGPAAQAQVSLARVLKGLAPPSKTPALAEEAPDPKDIVETVETFRSALDLAANLKWSQAIGRLQTILQRNGRLVEPWKRLAEYSVRINRSDLALDAYTHLKPDPDAYLGAASALVRLRRLEEAHENVLQAVAATSRPDGRIQAGADALLARIALARRDPDAAREEAERIGASSPASPLPAYIEARLLFDQGKYEDAVPLFEQALSALKKSKGPPIPDLHFYAGDAFARTDRDTEAETEFVEELRHFPENTRARAALAMLYHTTNEPDAAERVVADMTRITPTADSYALAARLLKSFGKPRQAERVLAEMKKGAIGVAPFRK